VCIPIMPPKKKAQEAKVKKIVEDKTFGLKNKNKSKKVQQYVAAVSASAAQSGKSRKQLQAEETAKKAKADAKKLAEQSKKEAAELFKPVIKETKVPPGVDPKSILCEFFKAGMCQKGIKCKYSHDAAITLKSQKIDVYSDPRDLDTIDKWDTEKLAEVVQKKSAGRMPPTDIVCKFFLDAIENGQYGWFWECENGPACHYRHALPPGFVLKPKVIDKSQLDMDQEDLPSVEEILEEERNKLNLNTCTPVTLDRFIKWKEEKKKQKEIEVEKKRKEAEKKGGFNAAMQSLSGRDLFRYDPTLFIDDAEADDEQYEIASDKEGEEEEKDDAQPLYDRDAQGEVDINMGTEELDEEAEEEQEEEEEEAAGEENQNHHVKEEDEKEEKGVRKKADNADANALASSIDADLFLDEDVPDDDDDDGDEKS